MNRQRGPALNQARARYACLFPSHELPSHETRTPSTPSTRKIGSANEPKGLLCDIEIGHCVTRRSCARARAPQCCVLGKGQRVCALGKGQSMSGQPPPALTWARKLWWNTRTRQCQVCNCNFCCPHTFFAAPPFPQTHQCALATHRMCIHVEDDCKTLTSDRHPPQLAHIHIRLTSASSLRLADQSHLVPIHLSLIGLVCCCDYGERPILRCHCPSLRR